MTRDTAIRKADQQVYERMLHVGKIMAPRQPMVHRRKGTKATTSPRPKHGRSVWRVTNSGYSWMEIECNRCKTRTSIPLDAIGRPRGSPLLLRGFSEFSAQRQRDRDQCFSCRRSFSLRLQPQPGGFFFGFCRARGMLTGEPFNRAFFGAAGITSEPNRAAHRCSKRL